MGQTQDDVMFDWDNQPRRVTVSSFYIDQTELRNLDYLEYLYWLNHVYGTLIIQVFTGKLYLTPWFGVINWPIMNRL
jgi:sulfatase modifying factor 1